MAIEGKRIFLSGGAGFIGSHLCRRLVDTNELVVYDSLYRNALVLTDLLSHPNLTLVEGDVLDFSRTQKAMAGAEAIIHLVAIAGVNTVLRKPVETMTVNTIGTYNILRAALELPSLSRLVFFSSSEVFGTQAFRVSDDSATMQGPVGEARWTYAVSKLAGEHLAHAHYKEYGLPIIGIRPFNIYGPGQVGEGAIHNFVVAALNNQDLVVTGDGAQIRAWCYIDDIVDATLACLEIPAAIGEIFNVGNPRSTVTIYDLARRVISLSGSSSGVVFKPVNYVDIAIRTPSIEKARRLLGYSPKVELDQGIQRTVEWYRGQPDLLI